MSYSPLPTQRRTIEARIVRRAWADPDYRSRLLADPKAAIGEELGVDLPESLEVVVVEERPDRMCVVLPVNLSAIPTDTIRVMLGVPPDSH